MLLLLLLLLVLVVVFILIPMLVALLDSCQHCSSLWHSCLPGSCRRDAMNDGSSAWLTRIWV